MKKYKLLKDLQLLKAGAIFEKDGLQYFDEPKNFYGYNEDVMEDNPEWFQEIKEVKKGRSETAQKIVKSCNVYYDFDNDLVVRLGRVAEHIESNYIEKDKIREILKNDYARIEYLEDELEKLINGRG